MEQCVSVSALCSPSLSPLPRSFSIHPPTPPRPNRPPHTPVLAPTHPHQAPAVALAAVPLPRGHKGHLTEALAEDAQRGGTHHLALLAQQQHAEGACQGPAGVGGRAGVRGEG